MDRVADELGIEVVDLSALDISTYDYEHRNRGDDFEPLMRRALECDQILFATPVYWYAVSPPMKIFLDRVSDFLDLPDLLDSGRRLRGKRAFVICTSIYDVVPAPFIDAFRETFAYLGMRFGGCLHANCRGGYSPADNQRDIEAFVALVSGRSATVFTNPADRAPGQPETYAAAVRGLLEAAAPWDVLSGTAREIERIVDSLTDAQIKRPEAPGKWSVLHVLQHLADAEIVWGHRVRLVLAHDRPALSGYDQDRWAERLRYERADARDAQEQFTALRRANLRLLDRIPRDDWTRVGIHAERGEETLEQMMGLWAGHDLLHLRQLARIRAVVCG